MKSEACAILFSGGTDSMCSAAICAETFQHVHLITMFELATRESIIPEENVSRLRTHFSKNTLTHHSISTDRLVQRISYERYLENILRHGMYLVSTPGFSSLSWHARMIMYCLENGITNVFDGMTQELMHLPGHMPEIRELFTDLYTEFGIKFSSPVIGWDVPSDQRYVDRLIIDRHGFGETANDEKRRTTGQYLFDRGLLPHPNVKGSLFDYRMQHDCYPFVVYNMFTFWWAFFLSGELKYKKNLVSLFKAKKESVASWIHSAVGGSTEHRQLFEPAERLS